MIRQTGDMWSAFNRADLFLITTNSYVKKNGALVMGRGIARQARDYYPGLDKKLGRSVKARCGHLGEYGVLLSPDFPDHSTAKLGAFQVKYHFKDQADLDLITRSARQLAEWAEAHPELSIHLNYPGIGNGKLEISDVAPIVETLPDTVHIWTYK